ncbi:hypothetical protein [Streptomyces sp. NBC_00233]|uniref:DM13 domain-containing protein n=1 Tax=Streptomyces sp. NBC_00233 TaxID=2975686 RepID=UPI002B1E267B|nr:hypothetical protein [Streptomyces sp. NBC_00233]
MAGGTGSESGQTRRRGRRRLLAAGVVVLMPVLGAGVYGFQPWKRWQDSTVHEAFPTAPGNPSATAAPGDAANPSSPGTTAGSAKPAGPTAVAQGDLISHEHATTGTARLVRLPDGSHVLRLENLDTGNGPDLRVPAPGRSGHPCCP